MSDKNKSAPQRAVRFNLRLDADNKSELVSALRAIATHIDRGCLRLGLVADFLKEVQAGHSVFIDRESMTAVTYYDEDSFSEFIWRQKGMFLRHYPNGGYEGYIREALNCLADELQAVK